jgi:DHA1 family bicyclomycin/chloramphenicol resistance-like MFS transporter
MVLIGVAPLLAPTVGQAIAGLWHWRAVFYALALMGRVLVAIVWKFMPETLPEDRRSPGYPSDVAKAYWSL